MTTLSTAKQIHDLANGVSGDAQGGDTLQGKGQRLSLADPTHAHLIGDLVSIACTHVADASGQPLVDRARADGLSGADAGTLLTNLLNQA